MQEGIKFNKSKLIKFINNIQKYLKSYYLKNMLLDFYKKILEQMEEIFFLQEKLKFFKVTTHN